eukprot:CAMPEP_0197432444 /NCGR_PEP_ID=MMETSP1175-20131217/486_1 /TAXON_ID=1003142 /ORGANISM="Triceratium dubium, Strain CCMP147" /LENGTH=51 /DNA_ID=CAMNT_0042960501 /DNA_START=211 /DNA_END=366 /DNA_ORIENTATION=+
MIVRAAARRSKGIAVRLGRIGVDNAELRHVGGRRPSEGRETTGMSKTMALV